MPNPFSAVPDHLFRNDGGQFVDATDQARIIDRDGRGLAVTFLPEGTKSKREAVGAVVTIAA